MADVFISYARADAARVDQLVQPLIQAGFSVWWDRSLEPGTKWPDVIDRELRRARCVVVVWSRQSVASRWVGIEAHEARRRGILVPVVVEPVDLADEFADLQRLEWLNESDGQAPRRLVEHVRRITRRHHRRRAFVTAMPLAALVLAVSLAARWLQPDEARQPHALPVPAGSIAVLPFEQEGFPDLPGLGDGIAIELMENLARVPELRVASQVASWAFASQPVYTIRNRLRVAWLVEGNVAPTPSGHVLVRLRLVDTATGYVHGSWHRAAPENELMELTRAMMQHLTGELPGIEAVEVMPTSPGIDGDAYRFYLLARALLNEGRGVVDRVRAESYLEEALTLQPDFAPAHAGLCQVRLWRHQANHDPADLGRAQQRCGAAVELAPAEPLVILAQAQLEAARGDHPSAVQRLRGVLEQDASISDARRALAESLAAMGLDAEAEQQFRRVLKEQPGNWTTHNVFANYLLRKGRMNEAVRQFIHALDLAPEEPGALSNLGGALLLADEMQGAIRAFQRSLALAETAPALSNLGMAYYYGDRMDEAVAAFERATNLLPHDFRLWSNLGDARTSLGNPTAADAYREAERLALAGLAGGDGDPTARVGIEAFQAALGTGSLSSLQGALEGAPDNWEIHYFAALAFLRLGEVQHAEERLHRAIAGGYPESLARRDPLLRQLVNSAELAEDLEPVDTRLTKATR